MKRFRRFSSLIMYVLIVMLPTAILSLVIIQRETNIMTQEYQKKTLRIVETNETQLDNFLTKAKVSLETLASVTKYNDSPLQQLTTILVETKRKDPLFDSVSFVDANGQFVTTTELMTRANKSVAQNTYFTKMKRTKQTVVSSLTTHPLSNETVFFVATPSYNNEGTLLGAFLLSVRPDYIGNILRDWSSSLQMAVLDDHQQVLLRTTPVKSLKHYTISRYLHDGWHIRAVPLSIDHNELERRSLFYCTGILFFFNIVFLLLKFVHLRIRTKTELEENENHKLELVGTLAASTAHEIKNPLTSIKLAVQMLERKELNDAEQRIINLLKSEIERINVIASSFLILGRPTAHQLVQISLQEIVEQIMPLLETEANFGSIVLEVEAPPEKIMLEVAPDHIKQILLNVVKNSIQALESSTGGTVTLRMFQKEQLAYLIVQDNGKGMTVQQQKNLFRPFVTNKENGTGLGLIICQRIIKGYSGKIVLRSTLNVGTEVEITLPVTRPKI